MHILALLVKLLGYFEAIFGCHGVLILGKSLPKGRQHPGITIATDWDAKNQFKQTKHGPISMKVNN